MSRELLIECLGITKDFTKGKSVVQVLKGVDLQIARGEMVAIIGSSGAGKSTLLHVLGTLEPPTRGQVHFYAAQNRRELTGLGDRDLADFRNRELGFVFQFSYLLPEFSALENVMMPAMIAGVERKKSEREARDLLEFVGLGHRLDHRPPELSGGEQQRVAIARAVILRPKLLLADEPTGNLDSVNRGHILELFAELNRVTQVSVLLVTHDQELSKKMHRILVMRDGVIVN